MKILHLSDLHFIQKHFDWITQVQDDFDVICLTGDLLCDSNAQKVKLEDQVDWITEWVTSIYRPIFICSGNHDAVGESENLNDLEALFSIDEDECSWQGTEAPILLSSSEWINELGSKNVFTDRKVTTINGITFGCIPYGDSRFEDYRSCDVILYHQPPYGLAVSNDEGGDYGCESIRAAIDLGLLSPAWILSGHIHNPANNLSKLKNTTVSNPGRSSKISVPLHYELTLIDR